ncbi:ABC transporter permease [Salmonirosea aquatica]|uniref:FtsX-like permease family protein n=1 Tax=Salmonirosea aquatica TaxID=2654236 RepID=A0A7C9BH01_9BACT|nr:FtsX-like permease family protein [Cytophagaceae bacterium SJW1-29]
MLPNYLKLAWRNLIKNKLYSFINVGGLSLGLMVAILVGLWIHDELTFDRYHENASHIAQVMRNQTVNGEVTTAPSVPIPLATELRTTYGSEFKRVVLAWWGSKHSLAHGNQVFAKFGKFMSPEAPDMLSLRMKQGSRNGLKDPASILLSESTAEALFGDEPPLGKVLMIDNAITVSVTGVYEDLPANSSFAEVRFIAPWDLYAVSTGWIAEAKDSWSNTSFEIFVETIPTANVADVSEKIKPILSEKNQDGSTTKPELFLHPMRRWHLFSEFENGVSTGGGIQFLWLFGSIGFFVLLLACINFVNLSTARSFNRAKEVGIRKAVGSKRGQLVGQFLGESLLVAGLAYVLAVLLAFLVMPLFNQVASKSISIPWTNLYFWLTGIGFTLLTGILAGSYPALYLSSFQPVKVLTGGGASMRSRRGLLAPRQILVVLQFTVSIILIIGTAVIFQQIRHAKNRPLGFDRNGLITLMPNSPRYAPHREAIRQELLATSSVTELAESASPTTETRSKNGGFGWTGKSSDLQTNFTTTAVSHEFGRTVGWQFKAGRDFSRQFASDSMGLVINQTAARFMGFADPVGETVTWKGEDFDLKFRVLGVIEDMVMDSPYEPVEPAIFFIGPRIGKFVTLRLDSRQSPHQSLAVIETVLKKHLPDSPFDYTFVDEEYDYKFRSEERTGQLTVAFSVLAILISCLGLFGLATFTAQQRTKEIGIRKVLGASVSSIMALLSKDFLKLVLIALVIASPIAWYFMDQWLTDFAYHVDISWWVFALAGLLAVGIALITVGYQSVRAALMNPVESLRSE